MRRLLIPTLAMFVVLASVMSCESSQTGGGGARKAGTSADAPLFAPASSTARTDNDEGVGHYQQGHWDVAMGHFQKAVKADANSAVVHYNVALVLAGVALGASACGADSACGAASRAAG